MSSPIRFHLDEHVGTAIALGLRRRGIDVTTPHEAGLLGADDLAHLDFARVALAFTCRVSHWLSQ